MCLSLSFWAWQSFCIEITAFLVELLSPITFVYNVQVPDLQDIK